MVRIGEVATKPGDEVWSTLAAVTAGVQDDELWRDLAALLPPPSQRNASARGPSARAAGDPIPWDADVFSGFLREAVGRHDYHRGDALVSSLAEHLKTRSGPYPFETRRGRPRRAQKEAPVLADAPLR